MQCVGLVWTLSEKKTIKQDFMSHLIKCETF